MTTAMLSRAADALYWMGRYLERAENTTRLLLVTEEVATEMMGLDESLARAEWADLLTVFPGVDVTAGPARSSAALAAPYLAAFSIDRYCPYSIFFSLRKARDNSRAVREALTVEVFINLNQTYRDLEAVARRQVADPPAFRAALSATHRGLLATFGAIEHTLSRDEAWLFLRLGASLERVYRTATILRAKLPMLTSSPVKTELPQVYTRWRALLRALSALENFRRTRGARLEPADVVHFTFFDPHAPRSLRYGVTAVQECLDRIADAGEPAAPARIVGRLAAELAYRDEEIGQRQQFLPFLDHVIDDLGKAHDALSALFFGA